MYSDFIQKLLGVLQRPNTIAGPGYASTADTPPFMPGAEMGPSSPPPTVAPRPAAIDLAQPETSKVTGGDYLDRLESEITRPMPKWQFQEPQRPTGVRGLLGLIASGIGHGAGAQGGVGGGLTAAYEGNQADMENRRQQAYAMQMAQYKSAYDEEANRRANLVKVMQQRRLDEANQALQTHQRAMEKNAARVADINENRYAADVEERANRRKMDEESRKATIEAVDKRVRETLESLEKRAKDKNQTELEKAQIRAQALIQTGGAGAIKANDLLKSADAVDRAVGLIDKQILDIQTKIGTKATGHRGELLYPQDANGRYPVLDRLEERKGRLLAQQADRLAKFDEMITGTTEPPAPGSGKKFNPVKKGKGGPSSTRKVQLSAPSFRVNPQDDPLGWYQKNRP